jgi:molecular chaperone DnaK
MKEAEEYSDEDKKAFELATTKNEAESLVYTAEKTVKDLKDKLSEDQIKNINEAAAKLKETLKGEDVAKMRSEIEELKKVMQEAGSTIYQQPGGEAGAGGEQAAGPSSESKGKKDDTVVEGQYEKVDEEGDKEKK